MEPQGEKWGGGDEANNDETQRNSASLWSHTHTHTHTHARTHAHTRTHTHMHTHAHTQAHVLSLGSLWCKSLCLDLANRHNVVERRARLLLLL